MNIRRIVTGVDADGKSVFVSDGPTPRAHTFEHVPQHASALVWVTDGTETAPNAGTDLTLDATTVVPPVGETRFQIVTLPPMSIAQSPDFDPVKAGEEQRRISPGLFDHFEEPGSPFHATPTVDLCMLLEGEVVLILDEGERTAYAGDVIIQNGTRHAWQNRVEQPATFLCVLVGARKA